MFNLGIYLIVFAFPSIADTEISIHVCPVAILRLNVLNTHVSMTELSRF